MISSWRNQKVPACVSVCLIEGMEIKVQVKQLTDPPPTDPPRMYTIIVTASAELLLG